MSDVVLAAAGQVGDLARALETLEAMPSIGLSQSTSSFNAMIRACIRHGQLSSLPKVILQCCYRLVYTIKCLRPQWLNKVS